MDKLESHALRVHWRCKIAALLNAQLSHKNAYKASLPVAPQFTHQNCSTTSSDHVEHYQLHDI